MRGFAHLILLTAVCCFVCADARADEIRLKDGSKINGTIIGYEDGAFKIETAYGFAVVRKTNIAAIIPSDSPKPVTTTGAPGSAKAEGQAPAPAVPKTIVQPVPSVPPPAGAKPGANASAAGSVSRPPPAPSTTPPAPIQTSTAPSALQNKSAAVALPPVSPAPAGMPLVTSVAAAPIVPPPPAPKPPPPKPEPLRELIQGSLYNNQTYGFSMFRPPNWAILDDARSALPEAITALGTEDHSTLLVIGRDTRGGTLDARASSFERNLRSIYENFRQVSSRRVTVATLPAVEQRFRGSADDHDWSVFAVTLVRDKEVFNILGMTYADSDLIQIQENVISKTIRSLQFSPVP